MLGQAKRLYELNGLLNPKPKALNSAKIISITSGKGGTGKSFIACNLALELAAKGSKVLLVDLDINMSNQNVLFNLSPKDTIYHYLTYNRSIEDVITPYSENLHLIFGESGKLDHPTLNEDKVNLLVNDLKGLSDQYDVIIFDTASGVESGNVQLLLKSDEVVIVTSPEPTSVMDAYVILKLLKSNGADQKTDVIVNKCFDEKSAIETFENLESATKHFLKTEINFLGKLSFSEDVVKSIQDQKPIIESKKSQNISAQIEEISSNLRKTTIG